MIIFIGYYPLRRRYPIYCACTRPEGQSSKYVISLGRQVVTYLLPKNEESLLRSDEITCCPVPSRVPAIFRIGYVSEGTPENLESKVKAVKCNFDLITTTFRNSVADSQPILNLQYLAEDYSSLGIEEHSIGRLTFNFKFPHIRCCIAVMIFISRNAQNCQFI